MHIKLIRLFSLASSQKSSLIMCIHVQRCLAISTPNLIDSKIDEWQKKKRRTNHNFRIMETAPRITTLKKTR